MSKEKRYMAYAKGISKKENIKEIKPTGNSVLGKLKKYKNEKEK